MVSSDLLFGGRVFFFFLFFLFFCLRPLRLWNMSYLLYVCCWGVCMCQAVIVLIFGLKFCKGETQELLVAANMFSCYAPSCDRGIVIWEEGD